MKRFVLLCAFAFMIVACTPATPVPTATPIPPTATPTPIPFILSSSTFSEGQEIPKDYSCKGINISPALAWTEPPAGTQSFALIMDDPQASWTHWTLFNIPASARELQEALPTDPELGDGSLQGKTSFGSSGYGGPCPPSKHTYVFMLYALDTTLSLPTKAFGFEIISAMDGHVLASAKLTGTFTP